MTLCECGCGQTARNRFCWGHNTKNRIWSADNKERIKNGLLRFHSEHPNYLREHRHRFFSKEDRLSLSRKLSGIGNGMFQQHHGEQTKAKISTNRKGKCLGNRYGIANLEPYNQIPLKDRLWRISYEQWLEKIQKAQVRKPTKLEKRLISIIAQYSLPFDYVGDGKIFIAGKVPDFINNNHKKQLIEVFGNYWHKSEDEANRKNHFAKYGFDTLILWENNLRNISDSEIAQKIEAWEA